MIAVFPSISFNHESKVVKFSSKIIIDCVRERIEKVRRKRKR